MTSSYITSGFLNPQLVPNNPNNSTKPESSVLTNNNPTTANTNGDLSKEQFPNWRELIAAGDLLYNQFRTIRQELASMHPDERRDIAKECGYPKAAPSAETYQQMYDNEGIATRVVEVMPKESWKVKPVVYEVEDPKQETPFERSFRGLCRYMDDEENFHGYDEDETGANPGFKLWEVLERADIQSGIGQYGIILIGIDDGKSLEQPVDGYEDGFKGVYRLSPLQLSPVTTPALAPVVSGDNPTPADSYPPINGPKVGRPPNPAPPERRLLYLSVYPESLAPVSTYETNITSPRYGKPKTYSITLIDDAVSGVSSSVPEQRNVEVHWSRVIHVADNIGTSPIFGVPRQKPVLRRLLDLEKLYAGSAEMYWKGAFFGLSLETLPELGASAKIDIPAVKAMMENYMNGLQRYLALKGMSAKTLAPQVVDPSQQIQVQIDAICITKGIPKRIFMGSERGEMASTQDDTAWNERIEERRNNYLTPRVVVPTINRLIGMKVLSRPSKTYRCYWPDCSALSDLEKANIAVQKSIAVSNYATSGADQFMPPEYFFNRLMNMTEAEVVEMLNKAKEYWKAKQDEEITQQKKKIDSGVEKDPTKPDKVMVGGGKGPNPKGNKKGKASRGNGAREAPRGGIVEAKE